MYLHYEPFPVIFPCTSLCEALAEPLRHSLIIIYCIYFQSNTDKSTGAASVHHSSSEDPSPSHQEHSTARDTDVGSQVANSKSILFTNQLDIALYSYIDTSFYV